MSCEEVEGQEGKEDALLGLDEGWKEWLRPPQATDPSSDRVDVKDELKQEEEKATAAVQDEERKKDQDCSSVSSIKEEENHKDLDDTNEELSESQYKTIAFKSYNSKFKKEVPFDDISSIFTEDFLLYERRRYHQKIFNEIVNERQKIEFKELQTQYINYLRKAADLETFSCSKCGYQTIHKLNMQSHLFLIHKKEMEMRMYQCTTEYCKYKTRNLNFLKKHLITHKESYSDLDTPTDNDWEIDDQPRKNQTRKKYSKTVNKTKRISFLCDFCSFKGHSRDSIKKHLETHKCPDNPNRYLCYVCDYGVNHKTSLQKHLLKVHKIFTKGVHKFKEKKCDYCDYTTDSKECFDIHMMQHKNPDEIKWLKCTFCDFKTKHKAALRYHLKNHKVPEEQLRKFMCEVCSKKFKTKGSLDIHCLRHKSISEVTKIFKCSECKFQTKFKTSLSAHMEVHRDPTHVCDICGFRCRRKYNYEMHLLTHKTETEVEVFKCSVCTYTTKFKSNFKKHLAKGTHLGAVKRTFSKRGKIKNPDGTIETDHTCDVCGVKLSSTGALNTHSRIHKSPEELEMFRCEECPFETKFKGNLVSHQKKHKAPEFKCEICGLQLRTKWNHNMHLLTHKSSTECELFNCCVCSYQTKFKPYLREHLKKRHNILTAQRPGPKPGRRKQKEG